MLTEGTLNNGNPIGYAQGIFLREYRGLRTVGHSGSSWGFRSQLVRFVEPGLSIAVACNSDFARPGDLAHRVADHYLAEQLGPESGDDATDAEEQDADVVPRPPSLTTDQLVEFAGEFRSAELDATYRFAVVDGGLVVRIEQEPPLKVTPVTDDRFEFGFHPKGWSGPEQVSLQFNRDRSGGVTGFDLSLGSERGIVFEKHH
jgi:hypothetical protein